MNLARLLRHSVFLGLLIGCSSDASQPSVLLDAAPADSKADGAMGEETCDTVTLGRFVSTLDDVSVALETELSPLVDDDALVLQILFERYSPEVELGTFELGSGEDTNFADCRRCVFAYAAADPSTVYFADRGTLTQRSDPFSQRYDFLLENTRLVAVTVDGETRASTPIEGGGCVELPTVELRRAFPPSEWICDASLYADGASCHCACGAFDPDCSGDLFTPAKPLVDCPDGTVCGSNPTTMRPECVELCDWEGRDGCSEGVCVYDTGLYGSDFCVQETQLLDGAELDEDCRASVFQRYCAVEDGIAGGYCDAFSRCRPICDSDEDCTEPEEACQFFLFPGEGLGYCGVIPDDG